MDGITLIKSKTFWFNLLAFLVIIANGFGYVGFQPDAQTTEYAGLAVTLINIIIRIVFTERPVVALFRKPEA